MSLLLERFPLEILDTLLKTDLNKIYSREGVDLIELVGDYLQKVGERDFERVQKILLGCSDF